MRPIPHPWSKLKNFELEPPVSVGDQVFEAIHEIDWFKPEQSRNKEIVPPLHLLESIESNLEFPLVQSKQPPLRLERFSMLKRLMAAAVILGVITTVVIVISISPKRQTISQSQLKVQATDSSRVIVSQKTTKPSVAARSIQKLKEKKNPIKTSGQSNDTLIYFPEQGDLWVRLVSYDADQEQINQWISGNNPVSITIDEYSSLQVSKPIVDMIKQLHQTKKSGKPSRKAKKIKKKLERWKAKDEQYFSNSKSALDPIDLGKLIFNN